MTGPSDRKRLSLESLIDWIRNQRSRTPHASLGEILAGVSVDGSTLIDIACVDLIERCRAGQRVRVEEYVRQYPQLADVEATLDLIDAEMCVAVELGRPLDLVDYSRRFPDLLEAIKELAQLHAGPVDAPVRDTRPAIPAIAVSDEPALRPPQWFSPETCYASDPGRWLIRGRDRQGGEVMAMKILELNPETDSHHSTAVLDACEAASKVRHPAWVAPSVAAIQHGHLGVIRPWIFGVAWLSVATKQEIARQLRDLASLAYCIEAAHREGATHGGIHAGNLMLDHEGKLRLLDAAASRDGLRQWLSHPEANQRPATILSTTERQRIDVEQLLHLITLVTSGWQVSGLDRLRSELRRVTKRPESGIAEAIGERLLQFADSQQSRTG